MADPKQEQLPAVQQDGPAVAVFGTLDPDTLIKKATDYATALAKIIEDKKLFAVIRERKHTQVEGWTTLGAMLGVFPHVDWSKRIPDKDGHIVYEARVSIQTLDGREIASAEMLCSTREKNWKGRDEYAVKSMAQTRATSKAFRLALSWIMVLAGYEATPLEEIIASEQFSNGGRKSKKQQPKEQAQNPKIGAEAEKIKQLLEEREISDAMRKQVIDQLPKLTKKQAEGWIKNLEKKPMKEGAAPEKKKEEPPQKEETADELKDEFVKKYTDKWLKDHKIDPQNPDDDQLKIANMMAQKKAKSMKDEELAEAILELDGTK